MTDDPQGLRVARTTRHRDMNPANPPGGGPRILGVDPGLRATGWAVLELLPGSADLALAGSGPSVDSPIVRPVDVGVITTTATSKKRGLYQADDDARCLEVLARGLEEAIDRHGPACAAAEAPGSAKGSRARSAMAYGYGVAVLTVRARTGALPLSVQVQAAKTAATGRASASKGDVAAGVRAQLGADGAATLDALLGGSAWPKERRGGGIKPKLREHVYDAVAVALAAMDSDVVRALRRFV